MFSVSNLNQNFRGGNEWHRQISRIIELNNYMQHYHNNIVIFPFTFTKSVFTFVLVKDFHIPVMKQIISNMYSTNTQCNTYNINNNYC